MKPLTLSPDIYANHCNAVCRCAVLVLNGADHHLEFPAESLVQQGLLEFIEIGELALIGLA